MLSFDSHVCSINGLCVALIGNLSSCMPLFEGRYCYAEYLSALLKLLNQSLTKIHVNILRHIDCYYKSIQDDLKDCKRSSAAK